MDCNKVQDKEGNKIQSKKMTWPYTEVVEFHLITQGRNIV